MIFLHNKSGRGGILSILIVVSIFILGCFLCWYAKKLHAEGRFLDERIKPYHREILRLVSPYQGSAFYSDVLSDAQTALKELLAEYGVSRKGETSRTVIDSRDNRDVVRSFALLYIYWHRIDNINSEENRAILSLKKNCADAIKATIKDVPDCYWGYFELSPSRFTFE